MHENEVDTDEDLVRRLLRAQFPQWADLPIAPPLKTGTDNAIFRLGRDKSVRLPRREGAGPQIAKEDRCLPQLAPHMPLVIPVPLATGEPGEGYPFRWSIQPWLEGREVVFEQLADPLDAARTIAGFLTALQAADASAGPAPYDSGTDRGCPLADRDSRVRECAEQLGDLIDRERVIALWEASLHAPIYDGPSVWVHGDVSPGNLIEHDGVITGAIDWALMGVGDPACDLLVAWNLFRGESRDEFRRAIGVDDATWLRGRGWGISQAMIALPYYLHTNPPIVEQSWHILSQIMKDAG